MSEPLFQRLPPDSRVLFIRLRNLGEAVLDTANLRALKRWRPDLQITTLVEEVYAELFAADPEIEAMPLVRKAGDKRSTIRSRLRIIKEIRGRKFAAVVNLHGGPTSASLTLTSGAKDRAGSRHFRNSFAYNLRIPDAEEILGRGGLHTVEYQFGQFKWLGLPGDRPIPSQLRVSPQMRLQVQKTLGEAGIDPHKPYAVIAPTSEFYKKRWMYDRFAGVAEWLINSGLVIVMTVATTSE